MLDLVSNLHTIGFLPIPTGKTLKIDAIVVVRIFLSLEIEMTRKKSQTSNSATGIIQARNDAAQCNSSKRVNQTRLRGQVLLYVSVSAHLIMCSVSFGAGRDCAPSSATELALLFATTPIRLSCV